MYFFLTQNDRLPVLDTLLSDSQGYVDITSGTPYFYWRLRGRPSGSGLFSGAGTVIGATSGHTRYSWTTGDVVSPGWYKGYWRVNFSGGKSETFPNDSEKILFEINAGLE